MKQLIISILLITCHTFIYAQSSIETVLHSIESNNKDIAAARQLATSQKIAAGISNNLPDPSVSYSHQYGNKGGMEIQGELVASQSFDFPTIYAQRNQLIHAQRYNYDRQSDLIRQEILLQAKNVCIDLIFMNQMQELLKIRKKNAEQLSSLYRKRLKKGNTNILELNKIELELLNVKNEERINRTNLVAKLKELAMLNGGESIPFSDTTYTLVQLPSSFVNFKQEILSSDRRILSLQSEQAIASRQIAVSKSQRLPGFEIGYRMNHSAWNERYNGFLVGIRIPLFSNRHQVKAAKATALYTELQMESLTNTIDMEFSQLYDRASTLKSSMDEYQRILTAQNNMELLNRAIKVGQISIIEYFANITTLYISLQNYMQIQNEYQKVIAQLYKNQL